MRSAAVGPRLFHILGTRLEAATGLLDGAQARDPVTPRDRARHFHALADEIHILADAIIALDTSSQR